MTLAVADRLALADLVHLYAAAVDDRRFGESSSYSARQPNCGFPTPRDHLILSAGTGAATACAARIAALSGLARTQHAIVGEVYAPGSDPDYALGRITCVAHHFSVADEQVTDLVWHLRYDDEYLRTRSGWRIHGRALTINAIETRPIRRLRVHPSTDREAAVDPSAASTAPQPPRTSPPGRSPGTP